MEHPKVVNSAYFSPRSGTKILTTCIDNRCTLQCMRAWDSAHMADARLDISYRNPDLGHIPQLH